LKDDSFAHCSREQRVANQETWSLIKTDHRQSGIIRERIEYLAIGVLTLPFGPDASFYYLALFLGS
jgi:hypothetical protein